MKSIEELRKIYGHPSLETTRRYIGQGEKMQNIEACNMPEETMRRYWGFERTKKPVLVSLEVMRRYWGIDKP